MNDIAAKAKLIDNQIECVKREIGMRKAIYPNLVARGKKTAATADYEIACMNEALNTLILAERSHLNKSFNRPRDVWLAYPENKPAADQRYDDFLIARHNPRYINKPGTAGHIRKYIIDTATWSGEDFMFCDKDITYFMPLPKLPGE